MPVLRREATASEQINNPEDDRPSRAATISSLVPADGLLSALEAGSERKARTRSCQQRDQRGQCQRRVSPIPGLGRVDTQCRSGGARNLVIPGRRSV